MFAAATVFLCGLAMIALGLLVQTMYDFGIVVVIIAGIGLTVRLVDMWRLLAR